VRIWTVYFTPVYITHVNTRISYPKFCKIKKIIQILLFSTIFRGLTVIISLHLVSLAASVFGTITIYIYIYIYDRRRLSPRSIFFRLYRLYFPRRVLKRVIFSPVFFSSFMPFHDYIIFAGIFCICRFLSL